MAATSMVQEEGIGSLRG